MTLRECIEAIENTDTDYAPTSVYEDLFQTVYDYDSDLAYDLTEDYCYSNWILDLVHDSNDVGDIQRCVENIDPDYGVYYDCGYHEFENANLDQLKEHILERLRSMLEDEESETEEDTEENEVSESEIEWIEEDDDFLTKEVK
ncbi:MAG: hypothetical protein IJF84_00365 [Thermoguttaceae bacterium]|nr:hypothetical protein [Thermoguttaceae bacterium]